MPERPESDEPVDSVDRAVDLLSTAQVGTDAAHYNDGLLDAASIIGEELGQPVRPPHPAVEADLDPVDAVLASSGWLGWHVDLSGKWWHALTGPVLVAAGGVRSAVLPRPGRPILVRAGQRRGVRLDKDVADSVGRHGIAVVPVATGSWSTQMRTSLSRQRGALVLLVLLGFVGGVAALIAPMAASQIFSIAIPNGDAGRAAALLVALVIVGIAAALVGLARGYEIVRVRDRMDQLLGAGILARALRLPAPFFRERGVADLAGRFLAVDTARLQVSDTAVSTVLTSAFGLVSMAYLFTGGLAVGLVTTAAVVLTLLSVVTLQWRARKRLPALLEQRSRTDTMLLALLDGLVAWRVNGAEDRAFLQWAQRQQRSTAALSTRIKALSLSTVIEAAGPTFVLAVFTIAVVAWPSPTLVAGTTSAPGVFLALYTATIQVTIAMIALGTSLLSLSEVGPALERLEPVLDSHIEGPAVGVHPGELLGAIALDNVCFGYSREGPPILEEITLSVEPGEFIACVGPSGSGKSTLLRLVLGFEQPWSGTVGYDGLDIATLDASAVRRQIGTVLQASQPLGATIRETVVGGRDIPDERVWSLLAHVGLDSEVDALGGLMAEIGDRGTALSGGQRQRLMIAAALAGRPKIILFDEATSALDPLSQSIVMSTVLDSTATRVVIAHRLSTIERADRVLVIDSGRLVEQGSPDELLRRGGLFTRLAARQVL